MKMEKGNKVVQIVQHLANYIRWKKINSARGNHRFQLRILLIEKKNTIHGVQFCAAYNTTVTSFLVYLEVIVELSEARHANNSLFLAVFAPTLLQ